MSQRSLDEFVGHEAKSAQQSEGGLKANLLKTSSCYSGVFGDRLILHSGAVSIYYYPEGLSVRADIDHVFSYCPPNCLERVVGELMGIVDRLRGFGVDVFHVSKAFDDDLYITVRAGYSSWEKGLEALKKMGFRKVVRYVFKDFEKLREMERLLHSSLQPVKI